MKNWRKSKKVYETTIFDQINFFFLFITQTKLIVETSNFHQTLTRQLLDVM